MTTNTYFLKRTGQAVLTLFGVVTLSFGLIRLMPGSPIDFLRAKYAADPSIGPQEAEARIAMVTNINPSDPVWVQYADYIAGLFHGDLGQSLWQKQPVIDILAEALPWTIFLSVVSLVLIYALGIVIGALMAYVEGSSTDVAGSVGSIVLTSIPFYVFALIIVWFLGYQWDLFPARGRVATGIDPGITPAFVGSVLYHAALPIASLVVTGFGARALAMRANSIQVLGNDYLRVAHLRGLSERRVALRYVGRNAILPMYTGIMVSIGALFGGQVILEKIFTYPGAGYYMLQAVKSRDYPLMMGCFLFITIGVVVGVYVADLTYGLIDPRAGGGGDRESF